MTTRTNITNTCIITSVNDSGGVPQLSERDIASAREQICALQFRVWKLMGSLQEIGDIAHAALKQEGE